MSPCVTRTRVGVRSLGCRCLADCGQNNERAHNHVRTCKEKPAGTDPFYPQPRHKFDQHWLDRKARQVCAVLASLAEDERLEVRRSLADQLRELPQNLIDVIDVIDVVDVM